MKKLAIAIALLIGAGSINAMMPNDTNGWYADKTKNTYGLTPLMVAIDQLDLKEAKALIAAGADKNEKDASGATAYNHAEWIRQYLRDPKEIANLDAVMELLK